VLPVQEVSQQVLSTQKLDAHSEFAAQDFPLALLLTAGTSIPCKLTL
jgi:hypothetical protein